MTTEHDAAVAGVMALPPLPQPMMRTTLRPDGAGVMHPIQFPYFDADQMREYARAALESAVRALVAPAQAAPLVEALAAERERCAKVCDEYATWGGSNFRAWFLKCAAQIRLGAGHERPPTMPALDHESPTSHSADHTPAVSKMVPVSHNAGNGDPTSHNAASGEATSAGRDQ